MGETLWQRWNTIAEKKPQHEAIVFVVAGEVSQRWTYEKLLLASRRWAAWLKASGVHSGDVCAILIRHNPSFYPLYMAIEALGAIPAVLAYPNQRLHPEKFKEGMRGMARSSGLKWVFTEKTLEPVLNGLITDQGTTIEGFLFPLDCELNEQATIPVDQVVTIEGFDSNQPCILQHSSGTTGLQKAVVLSHQAVLDHVARYGQAIGLSLNDKVVSWLPLYHDMGLIAAFHLPLASGITSVQLDPFEWVQAPVLLLEQISQEAGTLTWLPNFAYNLMADRVPDDDLDGIRLDTLRMAINCSEPVRADSHDKFLRRFSPYGLRESALAACYAMAETTFAVTQSQPGQRATELLANRDALALGSYVAQQPEGNTRRIVSSGMVIDNCHVRLTDEAGLDIAEGQVGEIWIRSKSLFNGYLNQPDKTAEVLCRDWYRSGDIGFTHHGELFIIGRKKDLIIVAGKNIYPEDIEDMVSDIAGVLPGRVVAFGEEDLNIGTEFIAVIAETSYSTDMEQGDLRKRIVEAGMKNDVTISHVHLVPPRWLIKSSSGKPSRRANQERINQLAIV